MAREALITQEGLEKLKTEIDHLSTDQAPRGRRSDQGGARVRRHLRELRVRRRQERAGPARAAHRPARGAAPPRERRRRRSDRHRDGRRRRDRPRQGPEVGRLAKFQIVGPTEANPAEHKLSNESPIGKALLGHKRGDIVTVDVRAGRRRSSRSPRSKPPSGLERLGSPAMAEPKSARSARSLTCSPSGGRSSSGSAARASSRTPTSSRGGRRSPRSGPRTRGSRPARRPRALPRRGADRRAPGPRQGRVPRPRRRHRADPASRARGRGRRARRSSCSLELDLGDFVGVTGTVFATRRGELSLRVDRLGAAGQEPAPAARQVPRPRGHRDCATATASST